jgi:hypothetical protein
VGGGGGGVGGGGGGVGGGGGGGGLPASMPMVTVMRTPSAATVIVVAEGVEVACTDSGGVPCGAGLIATAMPVRGSVVDRRGALERDAEPACALTVPAETSAPTASTDPA